MTPSEAPKALQASECSELLDPTRANCWISAQHQPGKFARILGSSESQQFCKCNNGNLFGQPGGSRWIPWPTMSRSSSWERLERAANLRSRSAESNSWAWHPDPQFKLLVPVYTTRPGIRAEETHRRRHARERLCLRLACVSAAALVWLWSAEHQSSIDPVQCIQEINNRNARPDVGRPS
jgi:hypothetical protein